MRLQRLAPAPLWRLVRTLQAQGAGVWVVGGAVRDAMLGQRIADWDLATDWSVDRVLQGLQSEFAVFWPQPRHPTVWVRVDAQSFTLTAQPHGTPAQPAAVTLRADLARRDLSVNALACDLVAAHIEDPCGGRADLRRGVLRPPHAPLEMLLSDPLRALRVVRFVAQLQAWPTPALQRALHDPAVHAALRGQHPARRAQEVRRLLSQPRPRRALGLLRTTGLLATVLEPLSARAARACAHLEAVPAAPLWRLMAWTHRAGLSAAQSVALAHQLGLAGPREATARRLDTALRQLRPQPPAAAARRAFAHQLGPSAALAAAHIAQARWPRAYAGFVAQLRRSLDCAAVGKPLPVDIDDLRGANIDRRHWRRTLEQLRAEVLEVPQRRRRSTLLRLLQKRRKGRP